MTTEEKAREFWNKNNYRFTKNNESIISLFLDFYNSQPPNLDLKCTVEFELLSEPEQEKYYSETSTKQIQYQQALTFRQQINKLQEELTFWKIGEFDEKIRELTKENQELRKKNKKLFSDWDKTLNEWRKDQQQYEIREVKTY